MRKVLALTTLILATSLAAQAPEGNPTDFLSAIATAIDRKGGACGNMYAYTHGNLLPEGWLEQTPDVWGMAADSIPPAAAVPLPRDIGDIIARAQTVIDITTLAPPPDGRFEEEIVRGLRAVAATGKPVKVRILVGVYLNGPNFNADQYLAALGRKLEDVPGNNLIIWAVAHRPDMFSWNHSKIIAVDGKYVITGGHNLWSSDYLQRYPVHDVSMRLEGPAAYAAFQFANTLWNNVRFCHENKTRCVLMGQSYRWTVGHVVKEVPPGIELAKPAPPGFVPIIAVGRAGGNVLTCGNDQNNPSDTAMLAVFDHAATSIRLSQQDLIADLCGTKVRWSWVEGERALARAIARNVDVQIVLSNYGAKAGNGDGLAYSTCVLPGEMWNRMKERVQEVSSLRDPALTERMKERFHLAALRFSHNAASHTWPNGWRFANHAKMIIVDDSVFYIGSSNFYSSHLQEFGYFVQNPAAARTLLDSYWNPLWEFSSQTAYVP